MYLKKKKIIPFHILKEDKVIEEGKKLTLHKLYGNTAA